MARPLKVRPKKKGARLKSAPKINKICKKNPFSMSNSKKGNSVVRLSKLCKEAPGNGKLKFTPIFQAASFGFIVALPNKKKFLLSKNAFRDSKKEAKQALCECIVEHFALVSSEKEGIDIPLELMPASSYFEEKEVEERWQREQCEWQRKMLGKTPVSEERGDTNYDQSEFDFPIFDLPFRQSPSADTGDLVMPPKEGEDTVATLGRRGIVFAL